MECPKCDGNGGFGIKTSTDEHGKWTYGPATECPYCHGTGVIEPAWEKFIPKKDDNK